MNRKFVFAPISTLLLLFSLSSLLHAGGPTPPSGEEVLFSGSVKPNVLIILDNSNSMDEDIYGNGVGSWSVASKTFHGKRILGQLVNAYSGSMRLGLMTYQLPSVTAAYIANGAYFVSYDPRSYCPNPPPECVAYCRDPLDFAARSACQGGCLGTEPEKNPFFEVGYFDESLSWLTTEQRNKYCALAYPKTNRLPNPSDPGRYIYYKQGLPFYTNAQETVFAVAPSYSPDDLPDDLYDRYSSKVGISDEVPASGAENSAGYSGFIDSTYLIPTDTALALGFNEFGRRVVYFNVGRTWSANSSPGKGYLHVPVGENQTDSLLSKLRVCQDLDAEKCLSKDDRVREDFYMSCSNSADPNGCSYIVNAGLTPTAGTLQSAISYFQGTYPSFPSPIDPDAAPCQKNFIVYVTDGLPSVSESGAVGTAESLLAGVTEKLQNLRDLVVDVGQGPYKYDIKTYIVGVGLTSEAKSLLDRMAVSGGADVNGRAYYADIPEQLEETLNRIFSEIQSSTYSFSLPSVSSVRSQEENVLYVASFEPLSSGPFWKGHLRKIQINDDGSLAGEFWDAGTVLENTMESDRAMKTYLGGILRDFTESIAPAYFGLTRTEERDRLVAYIRGKSTYSYDGNVIPNPDSPRKLGDIFHSNPVTIGPPSLFFNDPRDRNQAFINFRNHHQRSSSNGSRLVISGANDGQLHAFETGGGREIWSFIPPNLLPKLNLLVPTNPAKKHTYLADGPISAAEVWLGSGGGTAKNEAEWKTLLVLGLGRGTRTDTLWSKSPYCDTEFKPGNVKYNSAYPHYCGYYALDITDTTQYPAFRWVLQPQGDFHAPYLGEPWSKMVMGRVKINGNEKWVGFMGGGYFLGTRSDTQGKGFFVVDLSDGNILWSYTAGDNPSMDVIPGSPAIVDRDNDGFIDTAYIGDLAGNMWKFTFCPFDPEGGTDCNSGSWSAMRLFNPGYKLPIFNSPAVAKDLGYYWIFWGTGDKANPNTDGTQNRFFAVRDQNPSDAYREGNLQEITSGSFTSPTLNGWYIKLSGQERVVSDATVYNGIAFFTSYTPPSRGVNACGATGTAALYGVAMMPVALQGKLYEAGKGVFSEGGLRRIELGAGIPASPIVSQKPILGTRTSGPPDVFVAVSGGAGMQTEVKSSSSFDPLIRALAGSGPSAHMIHWKDRRVKPY